jgi:hypothetical protein
MELQPQFNEFLANIRPLIHRRKTGKVVQGHARAPEKFRTAQGNCRINVPAGSIRRSTAIRPLGDKRPDVDIVVVTNLDHTRMSPTDAMDLFIPFLDKYYP